MREKIGENIRIIRKSKGLTLQTLSKQIGISHQQLSRIENGSGTSSVTLERIAVILGVDMKTLIDEPEATLHASVPTIKNYIPDQMCNQMYARLYDDVIKPTNDMAIDKFLDDVIEKLLHNQQLLRNIVSTHAGKKELYEFTPLELMEYSQKLFVEFTDHAMRLSKNDFDEETTDCDEEME